VGESLLELALLGGPLLGGELGERAADELGERCLLVPARKTPRPSATTRVDECGAKTDVDVVEHGRVGGQVEAAYAPRGDEDNWVSRLPASFLKR
jgi:hypothetical protein